MARGGRQGRGGGAEGGTPGAPNPNTPVPAVQASEQETSSPTPAPPVQQGSRVQTVDGIQFRVRQTRTTTTEANQVLHKKQDRQSLTPEKRAELFNQATKRAHTEYELISLQFTDEDKLDDTYNLDIRIKKTKSTMVKYDMHDVFRILILDPTNESRIVATKDLFREYTTISIDQVAASNTWYHTWGAEPWYDDNLNLTYQFFENNVSENLWGKTFDKYSKYTEEQQGGPLFFIIMINKLLSNTEEAAVMLERRVRNFNISQLPGEDIDKAISLLNGAITRLSQIKNKAVSQPRDQDFYNEITKIVIRVMQSTSVEEFNSVFQHIEKDQLITTSLYTRTNTTRLRFSYEEVFNLAEAKYREMIELGTWTGVRSNESVFTTSAGHPKKGKGTGTKGAPECWNCGGSHLLSDCKQAKDKKKIAANRKQFLANRRKNPRSGSHKYRPPEKHEKHRRVIDDKPMVYNGRTKRWEQDPNPPPTNSSANVAEQGSTNTAPLTQVSQTSQGSQQVSGLTSSSSASSQGQGQTLTAAQNSQLTEADRERVRANLTRQMEAKLEAHLTSLFDQLESQL